MQYISLYRRYRPATFDDVIGQDHIVRTLTNQIKNGRVGHAYLFTGTRGTGKTSCAKIFAKAINCLSPQNSSPCGQCAVCKSYDTSANIDVLEIDAASNNGVDEMRELRDKVKFPPVLGKYKVFIIDEVHMLSQSAFNALLKTLEEPPSHMVFILATTEVQKLPQTILSRCLRFDFRLLNSLVLAKRIKFILDDIGKPYEEEAINCIANAGDGSVRDAISVTDMCVSYCPKTITYKEVLEVLGASSPEAVLDICEGILQGDISRSLQKIDESAGFGKNLALLSADITKTLRNIIFAKNCEEANKVLCLPTDIFYRVKDIAKAYENSRIVYVLEVLSEVEFKQKFSAQPRVLLETAVVRASDNSSGLGVDALFLRVRDLERKIASGLVSSSEMIAQPVTKQTLTSSTSANNIWAFTVTTLKNRRKLSLYSAAVQDDNEVALQGGAVILSVARRSDYEFLCEPDNHRTIELLLMQNYDFINKFEVICRQKDEDASSAVSLIKEMFDSDIVSIKK